METCSIQKKEYIKYFPQEYGLEFHPFTQTYLHTHAHDASRMYSFFPLPSFDFLFYVTNHIPNSLFFIKKRCWVNNFSK